MKKINNFKYIKSFATALLVLLLSSLHANSANLTTGTLQMKINGTLYSFTEANAFVEDAIDGKKITIGLQSKIKKVEIIIIATVSEAQLKKQMYLNTNYNSILVIFKKAGMGSFTITPSVYKIKRNLAYRYKNKKSRLRKNWNHLTLADRIKQGRGIARVKAMSNSSFYLNISPVFKNGILKELQGSFSGIAAGSASALKNGRDVNLTDGEFRVGIAN